MRFVSASLSLVCIIFAVYFAMLSSSNAHDPRPLHITLNIAAEGVISVRNKIPNSLSPKLLPVIWLSPPCLHSSQSDLQLIENSFISVSQYQCGTTQPRLQIDYPYGNPSLSTLVHLRRGDDEIRVLLPPGENSWQEPSKNEGSETHARHTETQNDLNFLGLGIRHILSGYDHLAFVLGLLLIAGQRARIIWAVTSFTLGHSLSLIAASFGLVSVDIGFVEIMIALSILLLARELYDSQSRSLIWRFPAALAFGFGLVHGIGFASVLTDLEIAPDDLLWSLINFNIGVEIGQLGFVFIVLVALALLERLPVSPSATLKRRSVSALIGIGASYWLVERFVTAGLF